MLIDTHSHVNFAGFKEDSDGVIKRSLEGGVWMINVGSQYDTSKRAVQLAEKFEKGVYAAVGLHPIHLETRLVKVKLDKEEIEFKTQEEDFDYEKYRELARSTSSGQTKSKVVAIGEIGLDYYYRPKTKKKLELFKEKQRTVLCKQLELAKELDLPVIFHCRMGHDDLLEVLKSKIKNQKSKITGVIHCFTGSWEQAQKYMEMGFYLGFNGLIFKMDLDEIIRKTPMDKILIETDCPYLVPLPAVAEFDSAKAGPRNEPIYVKYIAERIAQIKNLSYDKVAEITTRNAKTLFKI